MNKIQIYLLFLALCCSLSLQAQEQIGDNIIIENQEMKLVIGTDGKAKSLTHKASGQECLEEGVNASISALTEYRPYENELCLTYPAKERTFWSDRAYVEDGKLKIGFEEIAYTATISLNITPHYIGFKLTDLDYEIRKIGVKRKTEIDGFTLLRLPVKKRKFFGEWLNVIWDDEVAVNLLATDIYAKIDAEQREHFNFLSAEMEHRVKLMDVGAALITTTTDALLDRIDQLERDYDLPLGVEGRRSKSYAYSYYEMRGATPETIDEHIKYAKAGGFRIMSLYYPDFSTSMGTFPWNENYPNGMADLKKVTKKIKDAGMSPGFHMHYSKVAKNDPYVTPVPDPRLNLIRMFTLSKPLSKADTEIYVEENPEGSMMDKDRRFLKIGEELITYEGYTTERPYKFIGCERGALNTSSFDFAYGFKFGILDVDSWPLFIRLDQNTSIQDEIAERVASIRNEAGIDFVYFDGAEDVPYPYWHNVSKAQLILYNKLNPKPLVAEGALKSHFGWHILTRGNAFDIFRPEDIREAINTYPMRAGKYIAQDFTSINFGWLGCDAPSEHTIGMQPDMYEYVCSRGAAWDSPISMVAKLGDMRSNPRTADNLEVIRNWENARIANFFSKEQKEELKRTDQEHILLVNEKGEYELYPYWQVKDVAQKSEDVRAFVFERNRKTWVVFWHRLGDATLKLGPVQAKVSLYDRIGKKVSVKNTKNGIEVPVGKRRFLEVDLPKDEVVKLLEKATL